MNVKTSKNKIRQSYSNIAREKTIESLFKCCNPENINQDIALKLGYSEKEIKSAPEDSNLGLGCGNPVSDLFIYEGDIVLDLGSGAGFDAFLASRLTGNRGKVIGVDFSEVMIAKAKFNSIVHGYKNVEFRLGDIEDLPVESNSVNVVISNCAINLCLNKEQVFKEAFRVMKPGGKLIVSDVVLIGELPQIVKYSDLSSVACVAGAVKLEEYISIIKITGFFGIQILNQQSFPIELVLSDPTFMNMIKSNEITKEQIQHAADSVASIKLLANK